MQPDLHNRDDAMPNEPEGWRQLFAGYSDIVLVANSDAADIAALQATFHGRTLFVFFNKVYKILQKPFAGEAILVARSSAAGANIVYRREVGDVVRLLAKPGFIGILNLRAAPEERFSARTDFQGERVGFLDLVEVLREIYPDTHVPSSGFALAFWLVEQRLTGRVHLAGFSAKRSERWKLFPVHDWTFEQTIQRLLRTTGRLDVFASPSQPSRFEKFADRFPELARADIALAAADAAAERLEQANNTLDRLIALTRWQSRLDGFIRKLRPRTRKQRLADKVSSSNQKPRI